ncbi:MAG: thioesterase family protein [Bdellovibrionales bacterium]
MNLWFRFLWVILRSWGTQRIDVLQDSQLYFRTWFLDLDFNLHMNNGRYLTLMDLGRMDLMLRTGIFHVIIHDKWMPVVGSVHMTFRRSLRPLQKFELKTRVVAWDQKWFYIEQEFHAGNQIYARGLVKASLKAKDGLVNSEQVLAKLGVGTISPEAPERWRAVIKSDQTLHV